MLAALRMEQKLLEKEASKAYEEGRKAEAERMQKVEEGFVASSGMRPEAKKIELSPEEEAQARKDIERGLFKSIEEWAQFAKGGRQFRF